MFNRISNDVLNDPVDQPRIGLYSANVNKPSVYTGDLFFKCSWSSFYSLEQAEHLILDQPRIRYLKLTKTVLNDAHFREQGHG